MMRWIITVMGGRNGNVVIILDSVVTKGLSEMVTLRARIEKKQQHEDQGESGPSREKSKYKCPMMEVSLFKKRQESQ